MCSTPFVHKINTVAHCFINSLNSAYNVYVQSTIYKHWKISLKENKNRRKTSLTECHKDIKTQIFMAFGICVHVFPSGKISNVFHGVKPASSELKALDANKAIHITKI